MKFYSSLGPLNNKIFGKEMQYILVFPCVVDFFCGILYKVCVIKKHYKVYLIILLVCCIVCVGINIKYNMWDIFTLLCSLFSVNLITRMATAYRIFSHKDERLFSPTYGTSLFIAFHFLPLSSVFVVLAFILLIFNGSIGRNAETLCFIGGGVSEIHLQNERERLINAIRKENDNGVTVQTTA